ncbi:MAG TPA: hypothetical protein VGR11_05205, partial [Solirubrobacteraceae bacterium]|nr:hypothetical protein [Solirubrobacteraceae bacterium]
MLAVAFLLFRLIDESERGQAGAAIAQQHNTAHKIFREQRQLAAAALREVARRQRTTASIRDLRSALQDEARGRARAQEAAERIIEAQKELPATRRRIRRIVFARGDKVLLHAGSRTAIAPASAPVRSRTQRRLGRLAISVTDAPAYARRVRALTTTDDRPGLHVVVVNGSRVLGSTLRGVDVDALRAAGTDPLTLAGVEYRVSSITDRGAFTNQNIRVFTLGSLAS